MIAQEIKRLEHLGERALEHLLKGNHSAAKKIFQKLRSSPYVPESTRIEVRALAQFYRFTCNGVEARRLVRNNLSYIWGIPELVASSNFINPEVSEQTSQFIVHFTGAKVLLGTFRVFGPEYVCSYEALASTESEAFGYFFELVPVEDVRSIKVLKVEQSKLKNTDEKFEGVISTLPFTLHSSLPKNRDSSSYKVINLHIEKTQRRSPDLLERDAPIPSHALSEVIHEQFKGKV